MLMALCLLLHLLLVSYARVVTGSFGFPLDDAWIFQTYARNLATLGQWAFVPGEPSAASTSILWTPLLVPGHWLPISSVIWGYGLGLITYIVTVLGASRLVEERYALLVGLAAAFEWHLLWASGTGMDTLLFAALVVWFWVWVRQSSPTGLLTGLFGGVLMLARPEGLLALAVAGLYGVLRGEGLRQRFIWAASAGAGFAVVLVPLIAFNLALSGEVWPSTFYAKQAEYAILWQRPLPLRFLQQGAAVHIGGLLITLPGFVYYVVTKWRAKQWVVLLPVFWVLLHWLAYAFRLPVVYHNARYAIPTIPILVAYGVVGMVQLAQPAAKQMPKRLLSRLWLITALVTYIGSSLIWGVGSYARNVTFINNDMVTTAQWVAENRTEGQLVAAHDIGALGYFAPGPLLDLAGLVSPEVVPFMTDPDRLADYIVTQEATYLIVFPGWSPAYRQLVADPRFCEVYSAAEAPGYEIASQQLGPMTIYRVGGCE